MAQVGYGEGVPTVEPQTHAPEDYQRIQANPEQFGGLIARGEQELGAGVTKASAELFDIAQFKDKINTDDQVNHWISTRDAVLTGDPTKPKTGPDGSPVLGPDGKPAPDTGYFGLQGRAASDQREATLKALQNAREAGRSNLKSPQAQYEYDVQTRRMYADAERQIGMHADQQWKSWAGGVNQTGKLQALNGWTSALDDTTNLKNLAGSPNTPGANHAIDYINFSVQEAQLKYGNDPTILNRTVQLAKQELLKAQVLATEPIDPNKAKQILEKNKDIAGTEYQPLADHLRTRVDQQVGRTGGAALFAQANNQANSQFATGLPAAEGAKTLLRSFEGFKPQAYWDVNHWRVGYGSDTITKADGTIVPVTQNTQVSQEDAERDLNRRTAEFSQKAQTQIGADKWALLTPQAQAALTSVAYNYGALPSRVVQAAQSGDPTQISDAVVALRNDNGGINANRRQSEAGIISGRGTYNIKGDAFRMAIESNQFQNEEQRAIALRTISELSNAQDVAYNQSVRARTEAVNKAIGGYTTRFWEMLHTPNPNWVGFMGEINRDPALADAGPAKDGLMERVIKRSGEEQSLAFGPGYTDVKSRLLSDPGTPGHIADVSDIYRLPLGQLTAAGEHELFGIASAIKKGPDEYGVQKTRGSLESYAKSVMAKDQLFPGQGTVSTNKKGLDAFESKFMPLASSAYAEWIKAGKNPYEFLNKKNFDAMIEQVYPKRQRDADSMRDSGGAEVPPPPEGIDANAWNPVMQKLPKGSDGNPMNPIAWANKIKLLIDNPTPEMVKIFDQSQFGRSGFNGAEIIKQLTGKTIAPKAETPPAAPAVPAVPTATEEPTIPEEARERMAEANAYHRPGPIGQYQPTLQ